MVVWKTGTLARMRAAGMRPAVCGGLALHWCWVYATVVSSGFMYALTPVGAVDRTAFVAVLFAAICLTALGFGLSARLRRLLGSLRAYGTAGALARVAGGLLLVVASVGLQGAGTSVALAAAGAVAGVGTALLVIAWGRVCSLLEPRAVTPTVSVAFGVALAGAFGLRLLADGLGLPVAVAALLCPLGELGLLLRSSRAVQSAPPLPSSGPGVGLEDDLAVDLHEPSLSPRRFMRRTGAPLVLFGFTLSVLRVLAITQLFEAPLAVRELLALLVLLVATGVLMGAFAVSADRGAGFELTVAVFVTAGVVLMLLFMEEAPPFLATAVELVGYYCFEVAIWSTLALVAHRHQGQFAFVYGLGSGLLFVGQFACYLVESATGARLLAVGMGRTIEPVALMFVLLLTIYLLAGDKFLRGAQELTEPVPAARDRSRSVEALAACYQLSPRETDVVSMLAGGNGVPAVAEKLGVSENTVKTYVRRIFAKTAVHARQELIDLLDEFEGA